MKMDMLHKALKDGYLGKKAENDIELTSTNQSDIEQLTRAIGEPQRPKKKRKDIMAKAKAEVDGKTNTKCAAKAYAIEKGISDGYCEKEATAPEDIAGLSLADILQDPVMSQKYKPYLIKKLRETIAGQHVDRPVPSVLKSILGGLGGSLGGLGLGGLIGSAGGPEGAVIGGGIGSGLGGLAGTFGLPYLWSKD